MPNPHDHPTALADLQDSISREKVLRARAMTPEERLSSVFELSKCQFGMMLAGAMARLGSDDENLGWQEVRRGLDRLDRVREHGRFSKTKPAA
ncbi:MAG: hypothetical protein ABJQ29_03805 [Luteolibacter sp.]